MHGFYAIFSVMAFEMEVSVGLLSISDKLDVLDSKENV